MNNQWSVSLCEIGRAMHRWARVRAPNDDDEQLGGKNASARRHVRQCGHVVRPPVRALPAPPWQSQIWRAPRGGLQERYTRAAAGEYLRNAQLPTVHS